MFTGKAELELVTPSKHSLDSTVLPASEPQA